MCGRVVSAAPSADLLDVFGVEATGSDLEFDADWNLAPTDPIRAVFEQRDGERRLKRFRWGLVPASAKAVGDGPLMINARSETVADKPVFARLLARHRCIVPVEGFYEWRRAGGTGNTTKIRSTGKKKPFFVHPPDGLYAFAGLWDIWRRDEEIVPNLTILTTAANAPMQAVHDRMPVILPEETWDDWLDRDVDDPALLLSFLVPADDDVICLRPVSDAVNNVRNDGPELVLPVPLDDQMVDPSGEPRLFVPN
jgi:putative SOS response-associated peptidase YedK